MGRPSWFGGDVVCRGCGAHRVNDRSPRCGDERVGARCAAPAGGYFKHILTNIEPTCKHDFKSRLEYSWTDLSQEQWGPVREIRQGKLVSSRQFSALGSGAAE